MPGPGGAIFRCLEPGIDDFAAIERYIGGIRDTEDYASACGQAHFEQSVGV
jgi:hypothetical protein